MQRLIFIYRGLGEEVLPFRSGILDAPFLSPFTYSANEYLTSIYYVSGTGLGKIDTNMNKTRSYL